LRTFGSLALRQVRARRLRALLTAAGIVLGVAMILGVLLLTATIDRTFSNLFDSIYGKTDLVVSGTEATSLRDTALRRVRATEGVEDASARIYSIFTRVPRRPEPPPPADPVPPAPGEPPPAPPEPPEPEPSDELNVAGEDPDARNLTDAQFIEGRRPRRGLELGVQESWAEANGLEVGDEVRLATPAGERRFEVVGLFQFSTGLDFGGEGFAVMPIRDARRVMDKPRGFDEVNVAVSGGGETIDSVQRRLEDRLGRGVRILTPEAKSDEIEEQLQAFDVILYFFAAMALFVGGFLIFNAFNMTVFQRIREIGMVRTLGATRGMIARSVLREAVALGVIGAALGIGLGVLLALGLIKLMRDGLEFPVGELVFSPLAPIAAIATGLVTAVLGALYPAQRAGRTSPIRAVLGTEGLRRRPGPRRAVLGVALIALGFGGAFWLGAAEETTPVVAAAGMGGTIAIFFGIALVAPFVIAPLVGALGRPLRALSPVSGRLAADSARSDPGRTAATATGLMIGLALVVAVNSLGASFLVSIEEEFDRSFARDLTVQPSGLSPGEGPQQTIAKRLRGRLARIPEAQVVARERFLYTSELPGPRGERDSNGLLFGFDPSQYRRVDETDIAAGGSRSQVFRQLEQGEVTLGEGHADETGLAVGDRITLDGPSGSERTRVAGIVETVIFGGQTVGMSLRTMRDVYGVTADSELALKATSPEDRAELEQAVSRIVRRDYPNLAVLSNDELKANVESQINEQFGIFYAIVGVAIFASLFGIVNTLSMSVLERTREIGVLRALGASRWQVRRQVAAESLVLGLIGALLGIAVGAGLGYALLQGLASGIPGVEYRPPLATMIWVTLAGLVLGLIASILPARRAARLDVIRAISYE
jgi:putative ABC transport system permease protein